MKPWEVLPPIAKFPVLLIINLKHDQQCLDAIRNIFDKMGDNPKAGFNRIAPASA